MEVNLRVIIDIDVNDWGIVNSSNNTTATKESSGEDVLTKVDCYANVMVANVANEAKNGLVLRVKT